VTINLHFLLGPDDADRRLDRIIRNAFPDIPLSAIYRSFREKDIKVNGRPAKPDSRCEIGDSIEFRFKATTHNSVKIPSRGPSDDSAVARIEVETLLVLASKNILFFNKPAGMLVHDGQSSLDTLVRMSCLVDAASQSVAFSPGPLHRLDRNTSGLIAFSRTLAGARAFSEAIQKNSIQKRYIGILDGKIDEPAIWNDYLIRETDSRITRVVPATFQPTEASETMARKAMTSVFPLHSNAKYTLARIDISTGRTHQIRSQAAFHGHPLLGDGKYGGIATSYRYFLHSWSMAFAVPLFDDIPVEIHATISKEFASTISRLFGIDPSAIDPGTIL
jgi:23S rRNA pseudouridine955/2504/2580 synthase